MACRYSAQSGVFTGDGPVVVDQRLNGVRQLDHLGVAVDLHVGVIEFVGKHHHAGPRRATDVGRFGALRIAGDHNATGVVDPTGHRGALQRAVRAKCGEHHAMSRPDELQQVGQADHVGGRILSGHMTTLATER
jgi:hypothetical protein